MSRSIPSRFSFFAAAFLVAFVIARPVEALGQTVVSTGTNQNLQLTPGGTGNVIATRPFAAPSIGSVMTPSASVAAPICIVDGTNNLTIGACETYLSNLGFANSGTIWSFVPEDFTSDPFVNWGGDIFLFHQIGSTDSCATSSPFNCWMTEVPLTLPTHLTLHGIQNPSQTQGPLNAGTAIGFGASYPTPLGIPANATNWTGTGNHIPDFMCNGTGGHIASSVTNVYVQVWEALDRSGSLALSTTPGYGAPTAEVHVTCPGTAGNAQSVTFHAPTASGTAPFAGKEFYAGIATVAAVNGAGNEQAVPVGAATMTCPGAAGPIDSGSGCAIASGLVTIQAIPGAQIGNPPPLVDLSTCMLALGTGVPGVSPNSYGVKLQHLALIGSATTALGSNYPASNEPSCGVLGWTAQEQSGLDDVTFSGPFINTPIYSGYKSGNSSIRDVHMPSNTGPMSSTTTPYTVYSLILDGRGLGNGGARDVDDSTFANRCSGCMESGKFPTIPYNIWATGTAVGFHAHSLHIENDSGDGMFIGNLAAIDASGVTGFPGSGNYLTHFGATADPSYVAMTKVGKNGAMKDDANSFTLSPATNAGFDYSNTETRGAVTAGTLGTISNCSSSASPAVCASAAAGSVALPTGNPPTLVVDTTAVTANSQIMLTVDESLGTKLGITCNTVLSTLLNPVVTARSVGTSFTFTINANITVNKVCVSYVILN